MTNINMKKCKDALLVHINKPTLKNSEECQRDKDVITSSNIVKSNKRKESAQAHQKVQRCPVSWKCVFVSVVLMFHSLLSMHESSENTRHSME